MVKRYWKTSVSLFIESIPNSHVNPRTGTRTPKFFNACLEKKKRDKYIFWQFYFESNVWFRLNKNVPFLLIQKDLIYLALAALSESPLPSVCLRRLWKGFKRATDTLISAIRMMMLIWKVMKLNRFFSF